MHLSDVQRLRRASNQVSIVYILFLTTLTLWISISSSQAAMRSAPMESNKTPGWNALVAKARNSNHTVRFNQPGMLPKVTRGLEEAFKQQFGFSLILELEPGHPSRETPTKIRAGFPSGRGVVDAAMWQTLEGVMPLLEIGALMKPDWKVMTEAYPVIAELGEHVRNNIDVRLQDGSSVGDYCLYDGTNTFVLAYHTGRVKPQELKEITWDDLAHPAWRNRLAVDNDLGTVSRVGLAKGDEWLAKWVSAIRANGALGVQGGSRGVLQAILSGEADIGVASWPAAQARMAAGAPVSVTYADVVPSRFNLFCIPKFTANDASMAQVFTAWYNSHEGQSVREKLDSSTAKIFPGFKNLQAKFLAERGLTWKATVDIRNIDQLKKVDKLQDLAQKTWLGRK